jgi:hypothetical protein
MNEATSEESDSVSEADATSDDGSRYRTLEIDKSGESSDDES